MKTKKTHLMRLTMRGAIADCGFGGTYPDFDQSAPTCGHCARTVADRKARLRAKDAERAAYQARLAATGHHA